MNQLEDWEINTYINLVPYSDRNAWEQTRTQMYITAQVNSTKKIKPKDLLEFAWEMEKKPKKMQKIVPTHKEIEKAKNMALQFEEMLKSGEVKEDGAFSVINLLQNNNK